MIFKLSTSMLHYYTIRPHGYLNQAALSKGQIYMSTLKLFLRLFKHMLFTPNQNEHLFTTMAFDLWLNLAKLMTQSSCNPTASCNLNRKKQLNSHASRLSRATVKTLSIQFHPHNNIFIIIIKIWIKRKHFIVDGEMSTIRLLFCILYKVGNILAEKEGKGENI